MVPNSIEFFEAAHGAGRLGAIAVPVNMHFKADEAGWIVADSGRDRGRGAKRPCSRRSKASPEVPRLVVGDGYERALAAAPDGEVDPPDVIGDGWPTTMAYTSGTTGRPKGVAIGEDDFRRRADGVAAGGERWGLGPDDVHLAVGPLYHSGPSYWAQMHLALGATVVVMTRWDARGGARDHRARRRDEHAHGPGELPADPRAARRGARQLRPLEPEARPARGGALSRCRSSARSWTSSGAEKVWEYYGASEGGGTVISPQEWLEHPGSVGKPFPGNEFVILDDDGDAAASR